MHIPPFLNPGDKIAMVSVAGNISFEVVEAARNLLESENFIVEIGAHALGTYHIFSGTDSERAQDMQHALDDMETKAIFFTRGGYGSLRTLMLLDWTNFFLRPKWLVGFSDITIFHSFLSKHSIASIHGVMSAHFFDHGVKSHSFVQLLALLRGNSLKYNISPDSLNRNGSASGMLVGGNLSLLQSLRGTALDLPLKGKVLFIEDISEYDYHIDRMMMNLKAGGALFALSGLLVGYFTDTKIGSAPFGSSAKEIILEAVSGYDFPVVFGFPAGHELPNYPLLMGSEISMEVTDLVVSVIQKI